MPKAERSSILFVSSTLSGGGAERFVSTALARLDRRRFAPSLALLRDDVQYPLPEDVEVHVLHKHRPWHIPGAIRRLARTIDATRPDWVMSAFAHPNLITGCALRIARHTPGWLARVSSPPRATDPAVLRPLMGALYRRSTRTLANSEALCHDVEQSYRVSTDYLPNATDFAHIDAESRASVSPKPADTLRIVAVGRLVRAKRFDLLIEAVHRAAARHRIELVVCGEGPERAALERAAERLTDRATVLLPGFVANPFAWMASADVFALSSDVEGLPNALVEAQGLGIPAVATDCPTGPAEVIADGITGLLVPPGETEAFATALDVLLSDAGRREHMASAARERARSRYAAEPVIRQLEGLLEGSQPRTQARSA